MKSLETSGRTVEEAIQKALETLNLSREEVEVTVLKEGKHGVLGIGVEEAKIKVEPLASIPKEESDIANTTKGILEELLSMMGVIASVVPKTETIVDGEKETTTPITFDIKGDDLGILIGRRGQTLSSLQYIVRLIVGHQTQAWVPIIIDVEGYKQRRYEALQALAWRIAEQVKAGQAPFTLEPMSAYERRIVHLALSEHPDVTTQSIGEGEARKVIILPKRQ